jgi:hypothetical protein
VASVCATASRKAVLDLRRQPRNAWSTTMSKMAPQMHLAAWWRIGSRNMRWSEEERE